MIILAAITGVVLFFYLSIGFMIPIASETKTKWYQTIFICIFYAVFWVPMLIATYIIKKWGIR